MSFRLGKACPFARSLKYKQPQLYILYLAIAYSVTLTVWISNKLTDDVEQEVPVSLSRRTARQAAIPPGVSQRRTRDLQALTSDPNPVVWWTRQILAVLEPSDPGWGLPGGGAGEGDGMTKQYGQVAFCGGVGAIEKARWN